VDDAAAGDGLRVTRMAVPLRDTEAENLLDHLEPCLDFVDEGRKGSGTSSFIASPGYPGELKRVLSSSSVVTTCGLGPQSSADRITTDCRRLGNQVSHAT